MDIGELEAVVLGAVTKLGHASSRDVLKEISKTRKLAYTSISTTLDRLYKKGLLQRDTTIGRGGQRYIYRVNDSNEIKTRIIDKTLSTLVNAFGPAIISSISARLEEISKKDLETIRAKIAEKRPT